MIHSADIVIFGTGAFAARIACDLAATAAKPTSVLIAGRNADRLAWLVEERNGLVVGADGRARYTGCCATASPRCARSLPTGSRSPILRRRTRQRTR